MKTAVKICGIRDPDMARQAIQFGARYIGIMCYKKSIRYVEPELGKQIAGAVNSVDGLSVGVFVDQDAEEMQSLCEIMGINIVQLHGPKARQTHHLLSETIQRIYVLPVSETGSVQPDIDQGLDALNAERDCIMYDGLQGGSGQSFDLNNFMHAYRMPFFLAGGLTVKNVANAIDAVHPDAVDVSSGVESAPGVKDLNKIKAFIDAVKGVAL